MRRNGRDQVLFMGTYVPEECGIATFTRDLLLATRTSDRSREYGCVAVDRSGKDYTVSPEVRHVVRRNAPEDYLQSAQLIKRNRTSLISVQHEYGIYGGVSGDCLLTLLENVEVPVVSTLHTLSLSPSPSELDVLQRLCSVSDALVVMSQTAASLLQQVYHVHGKNVTVIPHGVPNFSHYYDVETERASLGLSGKKVLSTFGLLSRGKGLEYVIYAMPEILKVHPDTVYVIIGMTHPSVLAHEGEAYRESLQLLAERLDVAHAVRFENAYLSLADIVRYLTATHIYITPYLNQNQIVSGTLAYALGCGKTIISTPYLYAKEMLSRGRGILVPNKNADAIACEANYVFSHPDALHIYEQRAYAMGKTMTWSHVGKAYADVFGSVLKEKGRAELPANLLDIPYTIYEEPEEDIVPDKH